MAARKKNQGFGGQFYDNPRILVEKISDIKRADHIVFERPLYEHHGIVVAVDKDEGTFDVIEYDGNKTKSMAMVDCITHDIFDEDNTPMYIVKYSKEEGECLSDDEVIENAKRWMNAKDYNFILNNCECMAHSCKTGKAKTEQVRNVLKYVVKEAGPSVAKGAVVGGARLFTGAAKLGTGISKLGPPMVAVGGLVEVGLAANDIHNVIKQNKEGKLNNRRRDAAIGVRVTTAAGDVSGGVGGMVVGGIVGGPIGVIIGGVLGGLGGRLLGWGASKGVVNAIEKSTDHFEDREEDNLRK